MLQRGEVIVTQQPGTGLAGSTSSDHTIAAPQHGLADIVGLVTIPTRARSFPVIGMAHEGLPRRSHIEATNVWRAKTRYKCDDLRLRRPHTIMT